MPGRDERASVEIVATQLVRIAEVLELVDGFLRSGDLPQLPDRGGFDTNLVIDLVSFNALALRVHCQGSLR
jgi:hypothetical protein